MLRLWLLQLDVTSLCSCTLPCRGVDITDVPHQVAQKVHFPLQKCDTITAALKRLAMDVPIGIPMDETL